LRRLSKRWRN